MAYVPACERVPNEILCHIFQIPIILDQRPALVKHLLERSGKCPIFIRGSEGVSDYRENKNKISHRISPESAEQESPVVPPQAAKGSLSAPTEQPKKSEWEENWSIITENDHFLQIWALPCSQIFHPGPAWLGRIIRRKTSRQPRLESFGFQAQAGPSWKVPADFRGTLPVRLNHLRFLYVACEMEDMGDFLCNVVFPPTCNVRFDTRGTVTSNQDSWPSMHRVLEGIKRYLQNRSTMWEVPFGREDVDGKASTPAGLLDKTVIGTIESSIAMDSEWAERLTIDFHGPSQMGHPTARESYFSFELELNHYDCELNKSASPIKDFFVMMTEATAHWTVGSKIGLELTVEEYREEDVTRFCKSLAPNVWSLVIVPPPYYRGNDNLTLNPELFLYRERMIFDDLEHFVMIIGKGKWSDTSIGFSLNREKREVNRM
ncbi:hypothetical protein CPC08DRAFT_797242 [Agrocybe pediades]|nr:hypothetical protein CPC08DRAFT_797242 [Agrocybe pediades]